MPASRKLSTPSPIESPTASRSKDRGAVASLFAGIGGFELGFERQGFKLRMQCENDPAAGAVLRAHFPHAPLTEDVNSLKRLPANVDLVTMGFPCQDLSQVGTRHGISGRSSSLVWTALALVGKSQPRSVLIENVPFMLQLAKGEAIQRITRELEDLGYRWAYRVVDARAFGLPQRRPRVFIFATLEGDPRDVLLSDDAPAPAAQAPDAANGQAIGFYWTEGNRGLGTAIDCVPPLKGGSRLGIPSSPAILMPDGRVVTLHIADAERLQGFPAGWTAPAESVGAGRARWRLVGNAVNVRVAEWLARRIKKPKTYHASRDEPMVPGSKWPTAAYNTDGTVCVAKVGTHPVRRATDVIADFIRFEPPSLSRKATHGIVSRLQNAPLRLPVGFLEALVAHLTLAKGETFRG